MNIVVAPDYRGLASTSGFPSSIIGSCATDVVIIMVVNGGNDDEQRAAVQANSYLGDRCLTVITDAGFNIAVMAGMTAALAFGADRVVRIDTAEHPVLLIDETFALLDEVDVVIRDLTFDESLLRPDSADEYHQLVVVPEILGAFSDGQLSLSGAHGFMGFRKDALADALDEVHIVLERAGIRRGAPLDWAADTALALVATRRGARVRVEPVRAELLRDRPTAKCAGQLRDTLDIVMSL
jgi:hypothetical protein